MSRVGSPAVSPARTTSDADLKGPLDSAWFKLAWATEHLKVLAGDIEEFLDSDENEVVAERETDSRYVLRLKMGPVPTVRWGLILGDAIHGLRGALDHAVWQTVLRDNGGAPETKRERNRIQFPIYDSPESFHKAALLRYVGAHSRAILDEAQPYHRGKHHPLKVIAALSNDDKHRLLIHGLCSLNEGAYKFRVGHNESIASVSEPVVTVRAEDPLEDGAVLGYIDVEANGPDPQLHIQCELPGFIAFAARDGVVIELGTVGKLAEYVNLVIKRFDLLFQGLVPRP